MAEKWELCYVDLIEKPPSIRFFTPGAEPKIIELGEYAKTHGIKKNWLGGVDWWNIYPMLLDDGWEPFGIYGTYNNSMAFRRKVAV